MYMYYVTVLVLHVLYMYRLTGTLSFALVKEKFKNTITLHLSHSLHE